MVNLFRTKKQMIDEAKQKEEANATRKNFGGKRGGTHLEFSLRTDIPDEMENFLKLLEDAREDIERELNKIK
jgi:hypothetical protein